MTMRNAIRLTATLLLLAGAASLPAQDTTVSKRVVHIADPHAAELQQLLSTAQAAVDRKDFLSAAGAYQKYLEIKPDEPTVHFDLGYSYSALGRTADAQAEFQKAIDLDPNMAEAYLSLGLILVDTDPASAVSPLTKLAQLQPDQARSHYLLGTALERSGKPADAVGEYQEAVKLDPKDGDAHFALGRVLLASHRASEAEAEFHADQSLGDTDPSVQLGLAESLAAQNKQAEAAAALATYLDAKPNDTEARFNRAALLVKLQKYDDALAELDRAAKPGPESLASLKLRAQIYFATNKYSLAVPVLQKAASLAPQDPNLPVLLGHAYFESKDYAHAADTLLAAIQKYPEHTDVLSELIASEYLNKNYPATLQGLEVLEKNQPLSAANWFIRAASYDKLGYAPQALDAYKKFLQMNTNENSDSYFEAAARVRTLSREVQEKRR